MTERSIKGDCKQRFGSTIKACAWKEILLYGWYLVVKQPLLNWEGVLNEWSDVLKTTKSSCSCFITARYHVTWVAENLHRRVCVYRTCICCFYFIPLHPYGALWGVIFNASSLLLLLLPYFQFSVQNCNLGNLFPIFFVLAFIRQKYVCIILILQLALQPGTDI